jgi:hypothetical protein
MDNQWLDSTWAAHPLVSTRSLLLFAWASCVRVWACCVHTDVSRYAGKLEHVFETTTAGVTIQAPQLDINTVAAGGGSRLFFRSGLFVVGPDSVGANPGPVCYRKGGALAITDANLQLGRILPEYFPHIFGPAVRGFAVGSMVHPVE